MHRRARFYLIQTVSLWFCLMLITLSCTGLTQGERVVLRAKEHLGKPYVLGAAGPDRFDCSGLVMFCLGPEGYEFPVHAAALIGTDERYRLITRPVELLPGDVVCFDTVKDRDPSDHMGFYIGANQFIHASSTGEVKISRLEGFYLEKFTGARRYVHVYTDLPTRARLDEWFEATGVSEKWRGFTGWLDGLKLGERLSPVGEFFRRLDLPGKFAPVSEWFASLPIGPWFQSLALPDRANDLWLRLCAIASPADQDTRTGARG